MQRNRIFQVMLALALLVVVASCAPQATPVVVIATKTPKPTFTPTVAVTPTRLIIPTATQPPTAGPTKAPATVEVVPVATAVPPTATPQPAPQFTANQNMNVRGGPGTNYAVIGQITSGDKFKVSGKTQDSSWLQFNFNGDPGWVSATLVTFSGDANVVQVALNVPAAPTSRPAPPPAPTSPPQPIAAPVPQAPVMAFMLDKGGIEPSANGGGPYFEGRAVYKSGDSWNWVCVLMDHYGNRSIKATGAGGKGDGNWGHSPGCNGNASCALGVYEIYVVDCPNSVPEAGLTLSPGDPAPPIKSDKFVMNVTDLNTTGQWYNIVFRSTQQ